MRNNYYQQLNNFLHIKLEKNIVINNKNTNKYLKNKNDKIFSFNQFT
jgi:hypothetical protein